MSGLISRNRSPGVRTYGDPRACKRLPISQDFNEAGVDIVKTAVRENSDYISPDSVFFEESQYLFGGGKMVGVKALAAEVSGQLTC